MYITPAAPPEAKIAPAPAPKAEVKAPVRPKRFWVANLEFLESQTTEWVESGWVADKNCGQLTRDEADHYFVELSRGACPSHTVVEGELAASIDAGWSTTEFRKTKHVSALLTLNGPTGKPESVGKIQCAFTDATWANPKPEAQRCVVASLCNDELRYKRTNSPTPTGYQGCEVMRDQEYFLETGAVRLRYGKAFFVPKKEPVVAAAPPAVVPPVQPPPVQWAPMAEPPPRQAPSGPPIPRQRYFDMPTQPLMHQFTRPSGGLGGFR